MRFEAKFLAGILLATFLIIGGGVFFAGHRPGVKGAATSVSSLVSDGRNTAGNSNAPVKIVEFGDFQCPACATAQPIVDQVIERNKDKILFAFRHYPLSVHKNAMVSSQAAEAAGNQGKFFEMYDILYERQKEWESANNPKEIFERYAAEIDLDMGRYREDFTKAITVVNKDFADGEALGVNSTPTFFINGQKYPGVISLDKFQQAIDAVN